MNKEAKYNIGTIVRHTKLGYIGVIVDIDPIFQASGTYNPRAEKMKSEQAPWYRLLVDESNQVAYVEEALLCVNGGDSFIDNPKLSQFLKDEPDGFHRAQKPH